MQRQILARAAWRAIAAVAGFFTLSFAFAAPVDLWNLTVKSRQGEPFLARVKIVSLPSERITTRCLSMGPETDAPDSEMPFLTQAMLRLDATGKVVTITTGQVITSPGVEMVLRVKCPGQPLYARHFTVLIPPATSKVAKARVANAAKKAAAALPVPAAPNPAPSAPLPGEKKASPASAVADSSATDKLPAKPPGFHLKLLPGDTVESVAAVLFPGQSALQQALVQKVLAGNPRVFPDGHAREVPAGTLLWFPDLPALRKTVPASVPHPDRSPPARSGDNVKATQESAKSNGPVTLRRALALGDRPGPQECRQLMDLCGAPATSAPASDSKFNAVESGLQQLHLKQDGIDQQLQRLEQSLLALQNTVNNMPAHAAAPPPTPAPASTQPAPPRVEIRTVVQSEPVEWYVWLALAGVVAVVGIGGFLYGRRGSFSRGLQETDEQLDRMLAGAADVMREFEANPVRVPPPPSIAAPPAPRPAVQRPVAPRPAPLPAVVAPPPPPIPEITFSKPEAATDAPWPTAVEPMRITDIAASEPAVEPPVVMDMPAGTDPGAPVAGLSNEVLFEMDQAMDNTRSMFTDVDRFIALGRIQNALSLLQFQVHKDPTDRDSWIKLLAIYRQEKMDTELTKAAREFKSNFPNENPPV